MSIAIAAFHGYYYTRKITTNISNIRMRLVRQRLHGFINPQPPLVQLTQKCSEQKGVRANVKVVRLKGIAMMGIKLHWQLPKAA